MNQIYLKYFSLSLSVCFKLKTPDLFSSTKNTEQIDFRLRQHLFAIYKCTFLVGVKLAALIVQLED